MTAQLLQPATEENGIEARTKPIVSTLYKDLRPLKTSDEDTFRQDGRQELSAIVSKAAALDAEFQKQRAVLSPWVPVHKKFQEPYGYHPATESFVSDNDFETLDEKKLVELVVAPGLTKDGNSDGEHYDRGIVLVKCRVVQELPEEDRSQSLSPVQTVMSRFSASPRPSFSSRSQMSPDGKSPESASPEGKWKGFSWSSKSTKTEALIGEKQIPSNGQREEVAQPALGIQY